MGETNKNREQQRICPFDGIAIVGLGLVGASLAAVLRMRFPDVYVLGVDVDDSTLACATDRGWVNDAVSPSDEARLATLVERCGLVVLATPVGAAAGYFELLDSWDYAGIITDTASTKGRIAALAQETLKHPERFVPGHPMAGSEKNGIAGARADLFQGAHWILCPDAETPADYFPLLHELITGIGARVIALSRESHDEAVAIVSHVPHVVASSLMHLAARHTDEQMTLMRLAAGGFKDSTRIAAGSPELWCGIAFDNAGALHEGLEEMRGIIESFSSALESGDRARFTALLAEAAQARRALPSAWVPSTEKLLEVRIPMEDHPGVVAKVTTIAGSVGCNIQSIEIDHITEDSAVLSMVLTDEGDIGQLSAQLIGAGFSVSFSPLSPKEHIHVQ